MSDYPTYKIKTLQDIFNLPTYEAVEQCLSDMTKAMLHAKAMDGLFTATVNHLAEKDGKAGNLKKAFEWPEFSEWIDDNKGDVDCNYKGPDGEVLFKTKITKEQPK
jgi:hypothetical protein